MLDESTDSSVYQNLVTHVRYLVELGGRVQAVTHFLGIRQLYSANAEAIHTQLVDVLKSFGFSLCNLVGVATDGASVMTGCKSGVVTRLREDTKGLLATHCIAHRLALGSGSAADKVRYLIKFQEVLNSIYKYFAYSPKNMARLEAIQKVLDLSRTRMKQVFHTRWLSFEGSVQAVVENYSALVSVFMEDKSAKALAMHKPITSFKFLYVAHFLSDVLRQLAILSKSYQRTDIDFTEVNPLLQSTVEVLEGIGRSKSGVNLVRFLSEVPSEPGQDSSGLCTFEYKGHTIKDGVPQRSEAVSACEIYIGNVVDNLRARFTEKGDAAVLGALTKLFDPVMYGPEVDSSVLLEVISQVSDYLSECGFSESEVSQELEGFVSYARTQVSCNPKVYLKVSDLVQLAVRCRSTYPSVAVAAERLLVSPVTTVDCECGFSRMNLIKTDIRNLLSIRNLENLMRLSMCDHNEDNFNFNLAFDKWASAKARRILM